MIYFIRTGLDGPVKIGWSKNVPERQRIIQPTVPVELILLRTIDAERWVEHWLHQHFSSYRLLGEWFSFDSAMLTIIPPAIKPPKPKLPKQPGVIKLKTSRKRRTLYYPERIQCKVPEGTIYALTASCQPEEELAAVIRRALREWLEMQKPKQRKVA